MILAGGAVDLRLGDWRTALADVEACDAVICDPPFSARTHDGQTYGASRGKDPRFTPEMATASLTSRGFAYAAMATEDVAPCVDRWAACSPAWFCVFTSHDLVMLWSAAMAVHDRYAFAPVACTQMNRSVRLGGDGPANWTDHLVCSRRRMKPWGALPGAYVGAPFDASENMLDRSKRAVAGAKPLWLMRAIVRDYTRPGDLVVDPFCGGGTTALACAIEGRRCITSEIDPATFEKARARLAGGHTVDMFTNTAPIGAEEKAP